ncbi:hypothetical protein [Polaribacter ponticola]|uniref:Helicase/UvrB N-terminal domain-containing protein n=1 Tax=Polaribacter ponticola TaxID=2978475 RepID=A0ABT5S759_9FLAO|nr:hypothetical protein [Polaribacter sp. MSW5]MDD7913187.1 hypothetical protein [Polaribacter sp. MSW5]
MKVEIIDELMGTGKTYRAILKMNECVKSGKKFVYITPFLEEVQRIKDSLPENSVSIPLDPDENIHYNIHSGLIRKDGSIDLNSKDKFVKLNKRGQFLKFISLGQNVIATHKLFMLLKEEDSSYLKDYILILDEAVNPLKLNYLGEKDIELLVSQNHILIEEKTKRVRFINDDYKGRFDDIKKLCRSNTVYHLDKNNLVWVFPIKIFKAFKEVQILTYLFKGTLLCAYLKLHNISFNIKDSYTLNQLTEIKRALNIYLGVANESKNSMNTYSVTYCTNISRKSSKQISDRTSYIFRKKFKTKSKENAYTTFKVSETKLSGGSYSKGFIPVNSRATNKYSNIKSMAYLASRYNHPQNVNFFRQRGIELNEELFALGELVQWIWRGCIRKKENMNLYIPSYKMRQLLIRWLNGEFLCINKVGKKTA